MNKLLVDFYLGNSPNNSGYTITDVWAWDDERLEYTHDYIQWLFPLQEASSFNSDAPLLDPATIEEFRNDSILQEHLLHSFVRMIEFYGLELSTEGDMSIVPLPNFDEISKNWLNPYNHNYRRITRILKSLTLLGLRDYAVAFLNSLKNLYSQHNYVIGETTMKYWETAVKTL